MKSMKALLALTAALSISTVAPGAASAQKWSATAIGVAEYDTDQTMLLLAGISAGPGGRGWSPRVGVQGYVLSYDAGLSRTNVTSIKPYVGMRNGFEGGSVGFNLGYAFTDKNKPNPAIIEDRGGGPVVSGGLDYWGMGGPLGYQLLGSYALDSESIWTRGRVTTRLANRPLGASRFGGEVAYLHGRGYSAWQPGVILEYNTSAGRILALGSGMKFYEGGDNAVYFKVEGLLPIGR